MILIEFFILWKSHGALSLILQKRKHDGDEDLNDAQRHKKNKVMEVKISNFLVLH